MIVENVSCSKLCGVIQFILYRQKISILEIHCQLMLVFCDGVLRPHHLWRGCREFRSGLASIMMIAPLSPADQGNVNTAQVVELVMENQQYTNRDLCFALEWLVKTVPKIVCVQLGYSIMEVHKNWCLKVLFHFFSHLKEEQMTPLNPWWYCETWVYNFNQNEF